jgi:eukaryotic-like serine/threonine-protein kinase
MTQPTWETVENLFHAAAQLPPEDQCAFLQNRCGDDVKLLKQVEALLDANRQSGDFLLETVQAAAATAWRDRAGQNVGPYRLLAEIGHGGMGRVFLAERADDQYSQKVAIKIVKNDVLGSGVHQRFRAERQILANLEHPGIARLLDGGATESGSPYLVMEYVDGISIERYCRENSLPIRKRLELFRMVCAAVSYAHRNLVVHRDLKPGNILVPADGTPRLLDFGIAKLLDASHSNPGDPATRPTERMMTPEYASPEQVRGGTITTATDVYALGLLLYELLAGTRPFDFRSGAISECERIICEVDPRPPSVAAPELKLLDGDLDHIVMKALRKEPAQRYHSAEHLSDDVARFLEGLPVEARSGAWTYRARKFVRRRRVALAIGGSLALMLGISAAVSLRAERNAAQARQLSNERLQAALTMANASLFDVHDSLAKMPGSTQVRALIIERTVQFLSELAKSGSTDPALRTELAAAYEKLSDIQDREGPGNLGSSNAAEASANQALKLRQSLAGADPGNPARIAAVAADLVRLAEIHRLMRNGAAAEREYRAAIAAYEPLLSSRASLADARREYARVIALSGDAAGALAQIHLALDARRQIADENPRDAAARQGLEHAWQMLGDIQSEYARQYEQASESLTRALTIARALVAEFPDQNSYRTDLASVLSSLGNNRQQTKEPEQAYPFYSESLKLVRELAAADPADARSRRSLAIHSTNLALVLEKIGQPADAERLYRESIVLQQQLIEQDPASRRHSYDLAFVRGALGRLLVKLKRADEGRQELQEAAALHNRLLQLDPENIEYRMRQSRILEALGDELRDRRDWDLALAEYQQAADLLRSRHGETVFGGNPEEIAQRIAACRNKMTAR